VTGSANGYKDPVESISEEVSPWHLTSIIMIMVFQQWWVCIKHALQIIIPNAAVMVGRDSHFKGVNDNKHIILGI
jgi:hypothetical protein